jgi:5-methylcytosine-specific restriction protein A
MQLTPRLRGHAAVRQREQRLRREPLCRDCKAKGLTIEATVPDHIIPLAKGGTDTEDNIRCLCHECHLRRTAEQFGHRYKQPARVDGWPDV